MFCPNCGARNSEADASCQKCGFNLKDSAGAKFKGTMLMMNNASALASDLRKSAPPTGAAVAAPKAAEPAAGPPPGGGYSVSPSAKSRSLSPEEAKKMRAKLKGTMIGVAPPAVGTYQPPTRAGQTGVAPGTAAAPAASAPSATPGIPRPGLPGPGQVNAPGAGFAQGGATMIGTGIGPAGLLSKPQAPGRGGASPADPTAAGAGTAKTEAVPVSADPFGGPTVPDHAPSAPTVRSQSPVAMPAALDRTQASASSASERQQTPANPGLGGTRVMSQFEQPSPISEQRLDEMGGTLLAGGSQPPAPITGAMEQPAPQFAEQAGIRTGTPAMGMPAVGGQAPQSDEPNIERYVKRESKVTVVVLTILTFGLYLVYRKFAKKSNASG